MADRLLGIYNAFLLDVDGVLVRGSVPIDGAVAAFALLGETADVLLLTNNSTKTRTQHAEQLQRLGFEVYADQVLASAYLAAEYLLDKRGAISVWPIGEEGIRAELVAVGHRLAGRPEEADAIVVGMDRGLTYAALADGLSALRSGAQFVATNEDGTFPVPDGVRPGAGAMVGALRGMGFAPDVVIGKPSRVAYRLALKRLALPPEQVLMVGDRLETDIVGAQGIGLDTALVLSGIATREDIDSTGIRPTWIADDLAALVRGDGVDSAAG